MAARAGTWLAVESRMKRKALPSDLVIDLLLPATFASRYRARLTSLSRLDAQLRLAFCPSVFRSGVSSCPADVTLVAGALVLRLRGVVEFQETTGGAVGQVHFDEPLERREFDALRDACQIDAAFVENEPVSSDAVSDPSTQAIEETLDAPAAPAAPSLH
jgi:hypothetical protein